MSIIENNKACVTHEYVTIYFCFVKVNHSQRLSQKPLTPWVIAENIGKILCGHCDCMAELGECCSQVASLLWAVECGVRYRESLTVTQRPAYWAIPSSVKDIHYAPVRQIDFQGKKASLTKMTADSTPNQPAASVSTVCNDVDNPSQEDLCQLFSALAVSSSKPAILALVEPHCESYVPSSLSGGLPIILSTLYNSEFLSLNYSELLLKASECVISVTPEQADLGENLTRGQNKSRLWSRMRSGRITASRLKDACCTDPAKPTETIISSICHPELSEFKTAATTWGCDHESVARNKYHTVMSVTNFLVSICGFLINIQYPFIYIGASPDGLVTCTCCGEGICEIKSEC